MPCIVELHNYSPINTYIKRMYYCCTLLELHFPRPLIRLLYLALPRNSHSLIPPFIPGLLLEPTQPCRSPRRASSQSRVLSNVRQGRRGPVTLHWLVSRRPCPN
ncbi:hypothetical protein BDV23DRAFT_151846 [Aspergillus alliaceus]|uniref:Uncharacterized protein n=1 Tax=Petromyces alliaceus TaxID=209559 RepID=A0A5N7CE62_PETAA|nr:hypothetical protein BDV23DRAFT_151846 [Aspergillus alliaceus]